MNNRQFHLTSLQVLSLSLGYSEFHPIGNAQERGGPPKMKEFQKPFAF
ncbi:MAG: hypothetical protein KDD70_09655 [Bdellovibrionales bacterium]|nr:hypothetical protein [Bdellovibrionales bacterium]